ncbi:MAG: hypothetical protein PUP91_34260 [Rhizonema sp. PD37]|nr:hypothetical protein [Rhizonema sp. PD37]
MLIATNRSLLILLPKKGSYESPEEIQRRSLTCALLILLSQSAAQPKM